jgi:hypothetical protein
MVTISGSDKDAPDAVERTETVSSRPS